MGTDIHMLVEFDRYNERWYSPVATFFCDRRYSFFAVLASVRNGYGFASVYTHDPITPIAEPRGLPEGYQEEMLVNGNEFWLGDHSFSWLTLEELKAYELPTVKFGGFVSESVYKEWDGKNSPSAWCGGVSGPDVKTLTEQEYKELTDRTPGVNYYIEVSWVRSIVDHEFWNNFLQYLGYYQHWNDKVGSSVRIIFGFDS